MPEIDFVMTYPCHFVLRENGNPESVSIDGESCICLFTDQDLAERFYKDKYGDDFVTREVEFWTMTQPIALINVVREMRSQLEPQGISHMAIDVTPKTQSMYVTFAELLRDLEKQAD